MKSAEEDDDWAIEVLQNTPLASSSSSSSSSSGSGSAVDSLGSHIKRPFDHLNETSFPFNNNKKMKSSESSQTIYTIDDEEEAKGVFWRRLRT